MLRSLPNGGEFLAYIDALGTIDGQRFRIDWKTTTSRYPEEPEGVLSSDPQLTSYSWISGITDVALVVFVRKRFPEIQYLKAAITDEQLEHSAGSSRKPQARSKRASSCRTAAFAFR